MISILKHKLLSTICPEDGFIRSPNVESDDIFLVSYPRSGNTWVRTIIAFLLYDKNRIKSLQSLNYLVPDIHVGVPKKKKNVRVIKTHRPYPFRHEKEDKKKYSKIIYICRNPIDVAKSYYHFLKFSAGSFNEKFDKFVSRFSGGSIPPGNWQFHLLSWKEMEDDIDITFIKYENLISEFDEEVRKICSVLDLTEDNIDFDELNKYTSIKNMQKLEKNGSLVDSSYNFIGEKEKERVENVSEENKKIIKERNKEAIQIMGYEK